MSNGAKALVAICLLAFTAACAQQEEVVFTEPEPVMSEPATTKY